MFTIITNCLWINKKNTDAISWKGPLEKRLQGILCIRIKSPNSVSTLTTQWFRTTWLGHSNDAFVNSHTHKKRWTFFPVLLSAGGKICLHHHFEVSLTLLSQEPLKTISHIWVSVSHFKLMECLCSDINRDVEREREGEKQVVYSQYWGKITRDMFSIKSYPCAD